MHASDRDSYLAAIGIDQWCVREHDSPAQAVADAPVAGQTSAMPAAEIHVAPPAPDAVVRPDPDPETRPPLQVPEDWAGLREAVLSCRHCGLCAARTQAVFGVGPQNAELVVVGEGPGADEDRVGEPFVGRAGRLLDEMLGSINRSREHDVYIANVVKCRPPGNRDPSAEEAEACRPYLEQQLSLLKPRLIVAVGRIAAQRLLKTTEPLARLRGKIHHWGEDQIPVWVTYHPAYLLRSPREKAKSWVDLKKIHRLLNPA